MKKYVVLVFMLFFLITVLLLINDNSYAYDDCNNKVIEPNEVTTLNLDDYATPFYNENFLYS